MKPKGEWIFRTSDEYLSENDGFDVPYVQPKPTQRFTYFQ
jgi:hypothetical protein